MEDKEMLEELDKIYYLLNTVCGNCIIEDEERDSMQEAICSIQEKYKQNEKVIEEMAKSWKQDDIRSVEEITDYFRKRC